LQHVNMCLSRSHGNHMNVCQTCSTCKFPCAFELYKICGCSEAVQGLCASISQNKYMCRTCTTYEHPVKAHHSTIASAQRGLSTQQTSSPMYGKCKQWTAQQQSESVGQIDLPRISWRIAMLGYKSSQTGCECHTYSPTTPITNSPVPPLLKVCLFAG
jgi:hypothetical protein